MRIVSTLAELVVTSTAIAGIRRIGDFDYPVEKIPSPTLQWLAHQFLFLGDVVIDMLTHVAQQNPDVFPSKHNLKQKKNDKKQLEVASPLQECDDREISRSDNFKSVENAPMQQPHAYPGCQQLQLPRLHELYHYHHIPQTYHPYNGIKEQNFPALEFVDCSLHNDPAQHTAGQNQTDAAHYKTYPIYYYVQ